MENRYILVENLFDKGKFCSKIQSIRHILDNYDNHYLCYGPVKIYAQICLQAPAE